MKKSTCRQATNATASQTFFRATRKDAEEAQDRLTKYLPYRFRVEEDGKARRTRFQLVTDSISERIPEQVPLQTRRDGRQGVVLVKVIQGTKRPKGF